jgi:hypothetical protein
MTTKTQKPNAANLKRGQKGMTHRRMSAQRYALIVSMMLRGPHTMPELAKATGLNRGVVWDYVNALRNVRPKCLRVGEWKETRTAKKHVYVAAYEIGTAPDERAPAKKTSAQRCREYRERKQTRLLQALLCAQPATTRHQEEQNA